MKRSERQSVRVDLLRSGSLYDIPTKLTEVRDWIDCFINVVPENYKSEIYRDFERDYNDDTTEVNIYYYRLETDEELKERKDRTKVISEGIKNKELAELARLREKYNV